MIVRLPASLSRGSVVEAKYALPRDCPRCKGGARGTVIGHGRRQRNCLSESESEIRVRRGLCRTCGGTITFLPSFLGAYRRYTFPIIESVLQQRHQGRDYGSLLVHLHDSERYPETSTVRRWCKEFARAPTMPAF